MRRAVSAIAELLVIKSCSVHITCTHTDRCFEYLQCSRVTQLKCNHEYINTALDRMFCVTFFCACGWNWKCRQLLFLSFCVKRCYQLRYFQLSCCVIFNGKYGKTLESLLPLIWASDSALLTLCAFINFTYLLPDSDDPSPKFIRFSLLKVRLPFKQWKWASNQSSRPSGETKILEIQAHKLGYWRRSDR